MPDMPAAFRPRGQRTRHEARREYDLRRGGARERGYTAAWDRQARLYRQQHPLCLGCRAVGVAKASEVVDHIVPHRGDPALLWDAGNWQPACAWHHDAVKQRLEAWWASGLIDAASLRLDSPRAVALTRELMGQGEGVGRSLGATAPGPAAQRRGDVE